MNQTDDIGGGGFADETITNMDGTILDRSSIRIDGVAEVTPTGDIDASGDKSILNIQGDQTLNQTSQQIAGGVQEEGDEEKEEEEFGNGKFSKIKVDETDTMSNKNTVLKRTSTMDDVYILQKFSTEKVKRILYLQSCVPKIKEFTFNLRQSPIDLKPPYIKVFEELLGRLIFFVTKTDSPDPFMCEGTPVKEVQKFMRELKMIDILMDILIYPFEGPHKFEIQSLTQKSPIVAICKLIYRILKHCSKDNEENKFYVAQWISHFFDQSMITSDQNNIMADETIRELLVDNKQLLQKQIGEKTIEKIVQNCSDNPKNSRSIKLLASLIQCNGEAIQNNQDFVCGFLLPNDDDEEKDEEQKAYEELLISVDKEKNGKHFARFKDKEILSINDEKPMDIIIENLENTLTDLREERLYNYFVEMINLIALMCLSRNMAGIIILQDTYKIDFVLDCFLNEKIGFNLRSNFAKLLISLHIDKDPLEQINVPVLTRVWQNIIAQKSKSEIPKSLAQIDSQLLRLKQFTVTFFNDMGGVQRSWKHEQNGLTNQVLLITEKMVLLGFYNNEKELLDVLLPIIDLLDGSNDFSSPEEEEAFIKTNEIIASGGQTTPYKSSNARYRSNESNEMIIIIKQKIIDILDKVMDIQNDIRLTKFLIEFYDSDSELLKDPMQSGPELTFLVNVEKDCIDPEEDESIKTKADQKVIKWMMNAYKNKNLDMKVKAKSKDKDLICILLDIILYDNAKLVNSAFTLLTRYFIQKNSLIGFATEVQLLQDNQEVAILEKCEEDIRFMKKEAGEAEFWMGVPEDDQLKRARHFVDKLELLTDLCIYKPNRVIDTDDKKKKNQDDEEEEEEQDLGFMNLTELKQEWDNEDPKICNDDEINDESNQRLLRNLKGYEIPILLIKNSLEEAQDKNCYLRVLEKSYIYLIKFVRNNPENQKLLVQYLDLFQDHIEYGVHAWELIGEIFKNSELLVSHNYNSLLKNVIKQIDNLPKETQKKTTMLSFLRYFMILNGTNMKDAQLLICTEITSSARKNCDHLFVGDVGLKDLHLYVLEMKNAYQEFMNDDRYVQEIQIPPELSYTIEYILLLGYAGEGQNAATETKAQEKLPIKDIIENMKLADFCFPLKSALTMFMNNIYFEIEKDVSDENIAKMYSFLEIIGEDLTRFVEIQMRMKSSMNSNTKVKKGNAPPEGEQEEDDLDGIHVDINKNFTMLTSFGSFPILYLIEKYIYENVFVALKSYFNLRLAIKPDQEVFFQNFIQLIQKSANFAIKESHKFKCRELFKVMAKTPSLKAFGGHNMNQKQIQDRSGGDDKQRTSSNGLGTIPQLTQAQKLKAYMKSVRISEDLQVEFEKEFEELVMLIINIKQESEIAFKGINTLDVKDIINALIQISNISSSIDKELRIVCLKVIRKVVEMENQKKNTPASEWEAEDWIHVASEIKQQQAMLIKLGVVDLVADLISFETKLSIKEEALQVSVAILLGGNPESQHNFNQYIINDLSNTFMHSLKNMITQSFDKIQSTQEKRNSSLQKKIQTEHKLETITQYQGKQSKKMRDEIEKCKLEINMLNEDLKETDRDESENPATYTTDALTVNRAIKLFNICVKLHQLFCENHNQILQNTLRQQLNDDGKSKNNSIDFPTFYAKNFETCQKIYNNITADIVNQVVETMTESIQGPCKLNQKALVQAKILDSSREYIAGFEEQNELENIGFDPENQDDIGALGEFKQKVVGLLTSLLEGEVDHEIMQRMAFSLDFECMKDRMVKVFSQFAGEVMGYEVEMGGMGANSIQQLSITKLDKRLNSDSFDGSLAEAVEIYILMHSLADSIQEAEKHLERSTFTPDQWKCFEFVRSHMGRIEVCVNGNLQRIYFPIKPVCDFLSVGARKVLMTDVDRESQATKVKGLMEAVPDLIDEMTHNEELSQAWLEITPARLTALKDFSTVVGMAINILYLCFAKRKYHYKELDIDDWVLDSIQYLGYVQGASSGILIFFYAINKKRLVTQKMWRSFVAENQAEGRISLLPNNERLTVDRMSIEMTHNILMLKGPKAAEFNQDDKVNFGNWFTYSEFQLFNMYFFIHDGVFRYYVLYFGISILGYISQDIYYSFHLLDVINRIPTLQNVIKSVTSNIEQLSLTLMLLMIIVYVFTSMTFFYLQDNMYDLGINAYDSDIVGENNCLTMAQCYISMLDKGLRNGGGIGDITESIHFNDQREKYFVKLFHDLSFFIVVNVIMLNVLFGIIIDTFAQLRDEKAIKDRDMMHVCFICNFPRLEFDKNGEGFEKHIEKDHNLWNYVYFILFLTSKNTSDHNGIESMIYQWYNNQEFTWIPRQKAMILQNVAADDENDNQAQEQQRLTMLEWQTSLVVIEKEISHLLETMKKKDEAKEEALKKKTETGVDDTPQETNKKENQVGQNQV